MLIEFMESKIDILLLQLFRIGLITLSPTLQSIHY